MQDKERRSVLRAPISVPVVEQHRSDQQEVIAVNISEHGMYYRKPVHARSCQGEEVFLTFSLEEETQPIKVLGWVIEETINEDLIDTHVDFMFLPVQDEEKIRHFVTANGLYT